MITSLVGVLISTSAWMCRVTVCAKVCGGVVQSGSNMRVNNTRDKSHDVCGNSAPLEMPSFRQVQYEKSVLVCSGGCSRAALLPRATATGPKSQQRRRSQRAHGRAQRADNRTTNHKSRYTTICQPSLVRHHHISGGATCPRSGHAATSPSLSAK
jgi:hypothetical protein